MKSGGLEGVRLGTDSGFVPAAYGLGCGTMRMYGLGAFHPCG